MDIKEGAVGNVKNKYDLVCEIAHLWGIKKSDVGDVEHGKDGVVVWEYSTEYEADSQLEQKIDGLFRV